MNNVCWIKVEFARNVKGKKFTYNLNVNERKDIVAHALDACKQCGLTGSMLNEMNADALQHLYSVGQIGAEFINDIEAKGFACGQNVNVELGGKDHVIINAKDVSVFDAYAHAKEVDKQLCNKISFAYNDKYGFLNSDIKKLGSGMSVAIKILLPALTKTGAINTLPRANEKLLFDIKCLDQNSGLYLISTGPSLGYGEKQICELVHNYIDKLTKCEIEACKTLAADTDQLLDACARAKAILGACIKIDYPEAWQMVGNITMAINSGLEKEIDDKKINELIKNINILDKNQKELALNIKQILKNK